MDKQFSGGDDHGKLFLPEASWIVPTVVSLLLVLISMHLVHKSGTGFVYGMNEHWGDERLR